MKTKPQLITELENELNCTFELVELEKITLFFYNLLKIIKLATNVR